MVYGSELGTEEEPNASAITGVAARTSASRLYDSPTKGSSIGGEGKNGWNLGMREGVRSRV